MRRLTRDIIRYFRFVVMLVIFVCLQVGLNVYYTNILVKSSSTTPGETLNTDSKRSLKHTTTLITNRTCAYHYPLLILVSSAPANLKRRMYIRKTWAFECAFKPRWTTVFLVAQSRNESESRLLLKEDEFYGDLVRASYYDHYWNQTLKIQMGFEWATRYCKFAFLLKVDDDVFVNTAKLYSFLSQPTTPKDKLYMCKDIKTTVVLRRGRWKVSKEEYSGQTYPLYCPGFGFVLSHDVAVTFVGAFAVVPKFRIDDAYVGMLAKKTGIKITHNTGFELKVQEQCIPNEGTLVRHGFYERAGTNEDCLTEIFNRSTKLFRVT